MYLGYQVPWSLAILVGSPREGEAISSLKTYIYAPPNSPFSYADKYSLMTSLSHDKKRSWTDLNKLSTFRGGKISFLSFVYVCMCVFCLFAFNQDKMYHYYGFVLEFVKNEITMNYHPSNFISRHYSI